MERETNTRNGMPPSLKESLRTFSETTGRIGRSDLDDLEAGWASMLPERRDAIAALARRVGEAGGDPGQYDAYDDLCEALAELVRPEL